MPVTKDILFMIGCPRSGTTLLNNLFRDELGVGFANELQLIPKFYKKSKRFGDLNNKKNLERFIKAIMNEPYFSIFKTTYSRKLNRKVEISYKDVCSNLIEPSFSGIIYSVLKTSADQLGTAYVGNKHLSMGLYLNWLYEMFPNARLVHVVRDGRDCALSLKRLWWGQKNTYTAAVLWKKHINRINAYAPHLDKKHFIEVRYEDFLSDPAKEMTRLYKFVHNRDPDTADITRYHKIKEIFKKDNTCKWKKKMDETDIAVFQAVAGKELALYNYEPYHFEKKIPFLEKGFFILQDRIIREYNYRFNRKQ